MTNIPPLYPHFCIPFWPFFVCICTPHFYPLRLFLYFFGNLLRHFHEFLCPFCIHFFTPFTLAQMLPVCSDETSSMLFLRFSDKYDDNLINYYVFQSL